MNTLKNRSRLPGLSRSCPGDSPGSSSDPGFSMVEVLMVVGIIIMLMSLVFVAAGDSKVTANRKATEAQILRLMGALEDYRQLKGSYPPDGYDFEVRNEDGEIIRGAACLHYFLTREIVVRRKVSGKVRSRRVDPLLELRESIELTSPEDYPEGVREIADPWRTPFWYDNTENGKFEPLEEPGHPDAAGTDSFPVDPRTDASLGAVEDEGNQGKGFDLWSYAEGLYKKQDDLSHVIASWNVGEKDKRKDSGDEDDA